PRILLPCLSPHCPLHPAFTRSHTHSLSSPFFFHPPSTPDLYTLSLHDALPISSTSTRDTSPTSTTRCGTPTVPRTARSSPAARINPGTGEGGGTGARCSSARSSGPVQRLS